MSTAAEPTPLQDRKHDLTRRLILDTAVELLESGGVAELTMRAVAKRAGMSERTVFRYFATRDEFLDVIAADARARMAIPPPPRTVAELRTYPRVLYSALEARQKLVVAGLHSELFARIREGAQPRWNAIRKLVDEHLPRRSARERKLVAANISYYLGASTWHHFRVYFGLSLEDTIAAAEQAIAAALG